MQKLSSNILVTRATLICEVVKQIKELLIKENCFFTFASDILCLAVVTCSKDITMR